jgi:predicted rRNA methylase YqxC with S4 and FtsJ domains
MKRLDLRLVELWPQYTRSTAAKFIKDGRVMVNELVQTSPKFKVTELDDTKLSEPGEIKR